MNKTVRTMVKNVIEENAVAFKNDASKALYEKVGAKLQKKYISVSKKLFEEAEGGEEANEPVVAGKAGVSAQQYVTRDYSVPTPPFPKGAGAEWRARWRWLHKNWNNQELWNGQQRSAEEWYRYLLNNIY